MTKRMLVDASHAEETRVVVLDGSRLEELDFEIAARRQLKGNIYLAKVTRVEPSLQAAFVEYGGNRHGFLAFSEIHPDYYRIPVADREALVADQALRSAPLDEDGEAEEKAEARPPRRGRRRRSRAAAEEEAPPPAEESESDGESETAAEDAADEMPGDSDGDETGDDDGAPAAEMADTSDESDDTSDDADDTSDDTDEAPETVGGDDVDEAAQRRPAPPRRHYKIQEVIKRRQIMLIQVTKEERGNKGAALTTYLSLAGRYCVLMPNTPRGGGISRKISNPKERKRMKAILDQMEVPDGMAVILRTAGLERTKAEIKRDLDYLSRLWESIRELTLKSTAPALIHEEANLIKRAERDLYSKEMEEIVVAGEDGYRAAKDFMRMLMPSHAKKVKPYRDEAIPLFHRYQVESQIDAMHSPVVQLRSGGYVVINPTEALVAIDVNSGRSTRERNIEETAYRTNLEAADEVARQLRLRDLAGLIVIDFIDMDDDRHNAAVERRLKEAMRTDRARIQVGRISAFGLLELSRQRLRPSLTETHFDICHTCGGSGLLRSVGSSALRVLRAVEEEALKRRAAAFTVRLPADVALYVLNQKRDALAELEQRRGIRVWVERDDSLVRPDFGLERVTVSDDDTARPAVDFAAIMASADAALLDETDDEPETEASATTEEDRGGRSRTRRTRRPRRRSDGGEETRTADEPEEAEDAGADAAEAADADGGEARDDAQKKKRRRGKRGGRRRSAARTASEDGGETDADTADGDEVAAPVTALDAPEDDEAADPWPVVATAPEIGQTDDPAEAWPTDETTPIAAAPPLPAEEAPSDAAPVNDGDGDDVAVDADAEDDPDTANDESSGPPRKGWWQRLI